MVHIHYDFSLVVGSIAVAILASYLAISTQQFLLGGIRQKSEKAMLLLSGLCFGVAIWGMHFVGMLACQLPANYAFNLPLSIFSGVIAFIASTFAIWLTTKPTLPFARLVIGAVLMGLGISGMHYTGMLGMVVENHRTYYDPLLVVFSVLIAISGSGLTFWLAFRFKNALLYHRHYKVMIAIMMSLAIVGMHYTGMASVSYYPIDTERLGAIYKTGNGILLFTVIFVTSLVIVAAFSVAVLE